MIDGRYGNIAQRHGEALGDVGHRNRVYDDVNTLLHVHTGSPRSNFRPWLVISTQ